MNQPFPVIRYAGEKPRKPTGIISLSIIFVGAVVVLGLGIAAAVVATYQMRQWWMWLDTSNWDTHGILEFAFFGVVGMGCLAVGTHVLIHVRKEYNRRRYQEEKEPNRAPW